MESKDRVIDLVGDLLGESRHQSPSSRQAESKVQSQESPQSQQSPHTLTETGVLARRFKVTLKSGGVLLHSAPSGLTRREAIELSKDWGEVAECVPVFTALEVSKPVPLDLTREDHRAEALAAVKRGDAVLVASARLCESVYWVKDEPTAERLKRAPDYRGEVCYTLAELRELAGQGPELLRGIHQFKKTFGATLEKVNQGVNASSRNTVRCGDCQHFQRLDHPHMGRCARGHGRHWLWATDKRQCEDFEAAVEGEP